MQDTAVLSFQDFRFEKEADSVKVHFMNIFTFRLPLAELQKIGRCTIEKDRLVFENTAQKRAEHKFNLLLHKGFSKMRNKVSGRPTVYVHRNSGIPLMGSLYFGIVDRGSNLLVVRPLTSCNMNCIFCSVDEGKDSKRGTDFVVEESYLVEEVGKLLAFKDAPVDIYINPQGEPLLYADIVSLVRGLATLPRSRVVSIITNGALLNEKLIDEMTDAGLTHINLSLNAATQQTAEVLEGTKGYNLQRVLSMATYASKKLKLVIAPVFMPGYNDAEMEQLGETAKELNADLLIQKFLTNKQGRNPIKEPSWDDFYAVLDSMQQKQGIKLIPDTSVEETREYPLPYRKGDRVKATIVGDGVHPREKLAVAQDRVISLYDCSASGNVNVEILRSKHNTFVGKVV